MNRRERLSIIATLKTGDLIACLDAIQSIRDNGGKDSTRLLLKATKVRDWQVRAAAIRALGEVGNPTALVRLILHAKKDSLVVQQEAVDAIGKIGHPMVVPNLINLLRDPTCQVRMNVARALGQIGDKRAIPVLINALQDENRTLVDWSADALALYGEAAIPELVKTLTTADFAQSEEGQAMVRKAAEAFDRPDLLQLDTRYDRNAGTRAAAGRALAAMEEVALPALVALLQNPERHIQKSALTAIANMGDPAVIPALQSLLDHPDADFRSEAVMGLGRIDDPTVVEMLRGVASDNNFTVRECVACALSRHAQQGNVDATAGLTNMLHDGDPDIRILAIEQLSKIATSGMVATLAEYLDDSAVGDNYGKSVGEMALDVLEHTDTDDAVRIVADWKNRQNS